MPLFFLHIRSDGDFIRDEEGIEYQDLAAAEAEAVRSARSMICEQVLKGTLRLDEFIVVTDAQGRHLSTIRFSDAVEVIASPTNAKERQQTIPSSRSVR